MSLITDTQTYVSGSQSTPALGNYDKNCLFYWYVLKGRPITYRPPIVPAILCHSVRAPQDLEGFHYILNAFFFEFPDEPDRKYYPYFTRPCPLDVNIKITFRQLQILFFLYKSPCILLYPTMIFKPRDIAYLRNNFLLRDITINNESVPIITNYGFHVLEHKLPIPLLDLLLEKYDLDMFPYFLVRRLIGSSPLAELPKYLVSDNKYVRGLASERCDQLVKTSG